MSTKFSKVFKIILKNELIKLKKC